MSFLSKAIRFGSSGKSKSQAANGTTQPQPDAQLVQQPQAEADPAVSGEQKRGFGKALREDFLFEPGFLNLNHGSFGAYPRAVRDALRRYQDRVEARPDHFIRYEQPKLVDESRAALAKLLHAPEDTIVMIQNATTAVNTVLNNLQYQDGEVIVYFDTIYGACEKMVTYVTETRPVEMAKVTVRYPITDAALVSQFRRVVEGLHAQGKKVKVAIFDVVSSMPGVRIPYRELSKACRELGVLSLVDGAHGVGQLDLDLPDLDFDFFVSNCHKWLFAPRACAVFYVPIRNQHLLRTTMPTSHGFEPLPKEGQHILNPFEPSGHSAFVHNFNFVGTVDNAPYLSVVDALAYRESIGGEAAIRDYCTDLNQKAGKRLAETLGTEVLENEEGTLTDCAMSMVRLPLGAAEVRKLLASAEIELEEYDLGVKVRDFLTRTVVRDHNTFLALTVLFNDAWWVRLSATVYLELEDFDCAAKAIADACEKAKKGDFVAWVKEKQSA